MVKALITVGQISRATGISISTVQYLLNSRKIQPEYRAGRLRVYDEATIEKVKAIHESIRRV